MTINIVIGQLDKQCMHCGKTNYHNGYVCPTIKSVEYEGWQIQKIEYRDPPTFTPTFSVGPNMVGAGNGWGVCQSTGISSVPPNKT